MAPKKEPILSTVLTKTAGNRKRIFFAFYESINLLNLVSIFGIIQSDAFILMLIKNSIENFCEREREKSDIDRIGRKTIRNIQISLSGHEKITNKNRNKKSKSISSIIKHMEFNSNVQNDGKIFRIACEIIVRFVLLLWILCSCYRVMCMFVLVLLAFYCSSSVSNWLLFLSFSLVYNSLFVAHNAIWLFFWCWKNGRKKILCLRFLLNGCLFSFVFWWKAN